MECKGKVPHILGFSVIWRNVIEFMLWLLNLLGKKKHPVLTGQDVVPRAVLKVTGKRKLPTTRNKNPVTLLDEAYVKYMS